MADNFIDLLLKNYDERFGVVNVRPALNDWVKTSKTPLEDLYATFKIAESRWQLPILDAMRVLVAGEYCSEVGAESVLEATETVARDSDDDEYFKSINALVASDKTAPVLSRYIFRLLKERPISDEFSRRLAIYGVGMLAERQKGELSPALFDVVRAAADAEPTAALRLQFQELLKRF